MGLPTDRHPATVLHQVDVFFLDTGQISMATEQEERVENLGRGSRSGSEAGFQRPGSQQEVPVASDEGTDVLLPAEVALSPGPFQGQVVHGQHHHLPGKSRGRSSRQPVAAPPRLCLTCCQVSLILSKVSFPLSEQLLQTSLKKLSPFR